MARRVLSAFVLAALATSVSCLYSASSPVVQGIDDSNYASKLRGFTVVELYAPWCGHCKQFVPVYEELAKAATKSLRLFTVAAVDADANKAIASAFGVKGFPTIVATLDGKLLATYEGERTAAAIGAWALSQAKSQLTKRLGGGGGKSGGGGGGGEKAGGGKPSSGEPGGGKHVVTLTADTFDASVVDSPVLWVVEFFAPWCGHCKQLAPAWAKAASDLAPNPAVKLGAVDCTAEAALCSRFSVTGYPTLLTFGADKKHPKPYDGGRSAAAIVQFASELATSEGPPPEVPQLTGPAGYAAVCGTGRQACVLTFLPPIADASAASRLKHVATLQAAAASFASRPWGWAWIEGGAFPKLEAALGVSPSSYPSVAMLSAKKAAGSVMRSSLSPSNLKEFLNLLPGTRALGALPDDGGVDVDVAPWDGKDAPQPEVVEEFDLSEL